MDGIIIVGVDGSVPSREAIRWSAERARDRGCELRLVHVLDRAEAQAAVRDSEAAVEGLLRAAQLVAREAADGIHISWRIARGHPLDTLSSTAASDDLLVVGTHKTGFIHGTSFGSRFLALAAMSGCAVAYIPELVGSVRRGVVVGVLDDDDETIAVATQEAARLGESLTLVRSRPDLQDRDEAHDLLLRAADFAAGASGVPLVIRTRVSGRPLAEALVEVSNHSALLVVPHAEDTPTGALVHDVLLNIACPTLVARPLTSRVSALPV